jgi:4-hydroxybenzoate polyprenyltransferase
VAGANLPAMPDSVGHRISREYTKNLPRSFGYWFASVLALNIGFALASNDVPEFEAYGALFFTFPLAVIYAETIPVSTPTHRLVGLILGGIAVLIGTLVWVVGSQSGAVRLDARPVAIGYPAAALLTTAYMWFRMPEAEKGDLRARDGLLWPVVAVVGVSALAGAFWTAESWSVGAAVGLIGFLPFASQRLESRTLAAIGGSVLAIAIIMGLATVDGLPDLSSMGLPDVLRSPIAVVSSIVSLAGFLAALQGWYWTDELRQATSDDAADQDEVAAPGGDAINGDEGGGDTVKAIRAAINSDWRKQYRAVAVAICTFSVLSSYLFLVNGLGLLYLFALFFVTHGALWLTVRLADQPPPNVWPGGTRKRSGVAPTWGGAKTFLGFALLGAVLLDGRVNFGDVPGFSSSTLLASIAVGGTVALTATVVAGWWSGWVEIEDPSGDSEARTAAAVYPMASLASLGLIVIPGSSFLAFDVSLIPAAGQVRVLIIYGLLLILSSLVMTVDREIWQELLVFIRAARPGTSSLLFLAVGLPVAVQQSVWFAVWIAGPFAMAAAAAFILNDLADIERDAISKPYRPFVRHGVDHRRARAAAWVLIAGSAALALAYEGHVAIRTIQLVAVSGAASYTPFVARYPQWKAVFAGALATLPIAGVLFSSASPGSAEFVFLVTVCAFLVGRETMMDALDVEGDSKTGLATVAARIGRRRTMILGISLQSLAALAVGALFLYVSNQILAWLVLGLFVLTVAQFVVGSDRHRRLAIRLQWIPMLVAVVGFLS